MKKYFNNNKHPLLGCPLARDDAQRFILPVHKIVSYFSLPSNNSNCLHTSNLSLTNLINNDNTENNGNQEGVDNKSLNNENLGYIYQNRKSL